MAKAKRAAIYLRVSTDEQTTQNQRRELERAAEHGASAFTTHRADCWGYRSSFDYPSGD